MRHILNFSEAHSILLPIYDKLSESLEMAFTEHINVREFANGFGRQVTYENRTKANIIHDHLKSLLKENFGGSQVYEIGTWNNIFALKVNEQLFIRFNKLDENKKISCSKTRQYLNYSRQGIINGLPAEPTLLFAGYIPDMSWSNINGIYISCPDNENIMHWSYEITRNRSIEQLSMFERNEGRRRRVTLKGEEIYEKLSIPKTGTQE